MDGITGAYLAVSQTWYLILTPTLRSLLADMLPFTSEQKVSNYHTAIFRPRPDMLNISSWSLF